MIEKQCTTCREVKPLDMFPRDPTCKDGHRHSCRACVSEYHRKLYLARKEAGFVRSRDRKAPEPLWAVPTHSDREQRDAKRLRRWRGPVNYEPMRARL